MSTTLKVVIAGCGVIGRTHATALQEFPGVSIVGLVDPVAAAAESMAEALEDGGRPRPEVFRSFADAFAALQVDLVTLATPSGLHVQQGLEVLAAGKHLVIEKPLDVDLVRAREIEAAAAEAISRGQVVSVISQHRFDPASVAVAHAVAGARFGRLTSAIASVAWWRSQDYYDSAGWRGTWSMDGGGALMNQGVHTVDLLLWFMGRPIAISAHTARLAHDRIEVEDTAVATLTFENGSLALLHATTAAYPGLAARVQLMGSAGSAVLDNDQLEYFHAKDAVGDPGHSGLQTRGNQAATELRRYPEEPFAGRDPHSFPAGHVRQYADILSAIREGHQPAVTVTHAIHALAVVRAVYVSATLNQPVLFEDVLAGKYDDLEVFTGPAAHTSS
ncbi:Gfo/Idh/MocA family oxidoreductase [Pseudarthrobacter equi]|uniref:Gfo/Idh/MocA family protein n=1 Tax=Pseudarthrobacter equi TaxID=728066 RepID=UPI0021C167A5|nr:Gfo/Idh/MocA family oxidoreductase [Pseudarthrobacter equi]MCT9627181.1 Gfo/Idh/MocA family oxidoreductase [Pseudarthrobacter equi]